MVNHKLACFKISKLVEVRKRQILYKPNGSDKFLLMENLSKESINLEEELQAENDLERILIRQPSFRRGLLWGVPRYGHPEGEIYKHIKEVYQNIDHLNLDDRTRYQLRIVALTHDTFKYSEDKNRPRDWSKHHAVLARNFLARFLNDSTILKIVELHDEAYYAWRLIHLYKERVEGIKRWHKLLNALGKDVQLYYLFFKCDTQTGDKNQSPLNWVEKMLSK